MDELRLVRREDQSLIVADDGGVEYRLIVDEKVLAELRHLNRRDREAPRVSPREIQSLVRAGKSRQEIVALTGADDADIERYEEPVLAERRFILSTAQSVSVRTTPGDGSEQQFGAVIAERLVGLGAEDASWKSWKDEEAGWMIGLDFISHEVFHQAVWSFEHRKGVLSPLTPDAVTLSQQGQVGDRLIPKLRAVDATSPRDRFDSGAFDPDKLTAEFDEAETAAGASVSEGQETTDQSGDTQPVMDAGAEFARRREIDQRAINSPEPELPDLGQTADLLDALRRRRGERELAGDSALPVAPFPMQVADYPRTASAGENLSADIAPQEAMSSETDASPAGEKSRRTKGRASIPSWDDILFGTRSDEDPV